MAFHIILSLTCKQQKRYISSSTLNFFVLSFWALTFNLCASSSSMFHKKLGGSRVSGEGLASGRGFLEHCILGNFHF